MGPEGQLEELKSKSEAVENKISELESIVADAGAGQLSESFTTKLEELKHQKELLGKHIAAIELDQAQSWQESDFGHDLVSVARGVIDRADSAIKKLVKGGD